MNKVQLGKILTVFGITSILASLLDFILVLTPLRLANPSWVYEASQEISERSIIPLLGLVILLAGLYLTNEQNTSKLKLNFQKLLGILSVLFGIFLILTTVFYTMTFSAMDNQVTQSIKSKGDTLKKQIVYNYMQQQGIKQMTGKIAIPNEMGKYFKQIDTKVKEETKYAKKSMLKRNVKNIISLILFVIAYMYTGFLTFRSSVISLKQLSLKKNQV